MFRLHAQPLVVRADARHAQLLTLPHLAQDRVVQGGPGPQIYHRPCDPYGVGRPGGGGANSGPGSGAALGVGAAGAAAAGSGGGTEVPAPGPAQPANSRASSPSPLADHGPDCFNTELLLDLARGPIAAARAPAFYYADPSGCRGRGAGQTDGPAQLWVRGGYAAGTRCKQERG